MQKDINQILETALREINDAGSLEVLENIRVKFLGRKGQLTQVLKGLGGLSVEEKKSMGALANEVKLSLEEALSAQMNNLKSREYQVLFQKNKIDVTYPGIKIPVGNLHPLTLVLNEMEEVFRSMGFLIVDGPEIEDEFHNFDALNVPPDHPARDLWDTFWLNDGGLLRTHTSPVQVHFMEHNQPPFKIVAPGRVFRFENANATHESNFYQMEGLVVDLSGKITVANFKAVMLEFLRGVFNREVDIRLRPSYFPFVEPGFEIDVTCPYCGVDKNCRVCKNTGWIEILGAGMVNQKVFQAVGLEEDKYEGFAFGVGLDRVAMLKMGVDDIRLFYGGDLRFLTQF